MHKEALRVWRRQNSVIKCIKNQLTNAFKGKYLEKTSDTYVGYNNLLIKEILTCNYDRFGKVSTLELEEVEKTFSKLLNTTALFGSFVKRSKRQSTLHK